MAGMKHPHVRRAIVILARFFLIVEWHITQLGFLMHIPYLNGMFDALAKRRLMSPLAGMKHTYARLAIVIFSNIFQEYFMLDCVVVSLATHFAGTDNNSIHNICQNLCSFRQISEKPNKCLTQTIQTT